MPAQGTAGGLLTLWKPASFTLLQVSKGDRFLFTLFSVNQSSNCVVGNIYGPHLESSRISFFTDLGLVFGQWNCSMVLGGDFNATLNAEDRSGRLGGTEASFSNFVQDWNLIDLPLQNSDFTWYSERNGGVWSRIDRWLLNEEAWDGLGEVTQRAENWGLSDHRMVALSWGQQVTGPKPFLFYNNWLLDKEFDRMVKEWWSSTAVQGWSGYVLQQKFKELKLKIKGWSGHSRTRGEENIKSLEEELQVIMERLELDGDSEELKIKRCQIISGLWDGYKAEESKWLQKSRVRWFKEGDKNTSFFHFTSKMRRAKNSISRLRVADQWEEDPSRIKEAIRNHFKSFFTRDDTLRPKLRCPNLVKLSVAEKGNIERKFSEEEIWQVIKKCDGNKAPGPDGFNFNFFKHFWPIIKGDILKFFEEFHMNGKLVRGLNASFIALIPKTPCPKEVADFRPISLIGSVYKLVAKVLAARLQQCMPRLISENQFAFTPGRQISDCIFIAAEVVDFLQKREEGGFLLKLDFAKAYDSIEWSFLLDLLDSMNFGEKWILWMKTCISTASLAVLVNGTPSDFFDIERGLRQGDPLSPLLFNICVNGLSCMLSQLLGNSGSNLFCGVKMGTAEALNHLQFADDTLLFCEKDENQMELLCHTLFSFLFASGLKLNMAKSELIGCNVEAGTVMRMAQKYGWTVGTLPITYLGAPLGGNPRRLAFWEPMLTKLKKKGRSYNSKYISLSGRMVILKAALNAIPIYWMNLFKAPAGIISQIEKQYRAFLWGHEERGQKATWIPWELVCKSKAQGGLGMGHISWKNRGLLLKWAWRYGTDQKCLWRRIIAGKYQWDSRRLFLHSMMGEGNQVSPLMKDIFAVLQEDSLLAVGFKDQLICGVGDGNYTRFWTDPWINAKPLNSQFPRIFAMAINKVALIAEVGMFIRGKWIWDIPFRRAFFGWELELWSSFMALINSLTPAANSEDFLIWCGSSNGFYSCKGLCEWAEANSQNEESLVIPKQICKALPPKVSLLVWQACHNKLATKANLRRRGMLAEDRGMCCLCNLSEENNDHLFLLCNRVRVLWESILRNEDIAWCCPASLLSVIEEWEHLPNSMDKLIWSLIPFSLIWAIWLGRNEIIFRGKTVNMQGIWDLHNIRLAWWIKNTWSGCPYELDQITRNLGNIRLPCKIPSPRLAVWSPPDIGILKCNVDGASKGNPGPCGVGGVIRNSDRKVLGFFALDSGHGWAYEAETKAILNGLRFCQQFLLKNVIVESDSTTAVGWVCSKDKRPWRLLNELNQIDFLMEEVNCLGVKHIYREENSWADSLANVGCARREPLWVLIEDSRQTLSGHAEL